MLFDWSTSVFSSCYETRKWREECGCLCLQVVRIYSFISLALYIVFQFVKTEDKKFYKRSKTCYQCLYSLVKTSAKFVGFLEQVKHSTASRVFTDLLSNSPKRSPLFSPGYESMENMFYFLNNIIHNVLCRILPSHWTISKIPLKNFSSSFSGFVSSYLR